jgi:hypothetical protein
MILPKVRDPLFVTIRRGGTLTDSDHHLLAPCAASCAEHVLHLFESAHPEDPRPRQAIEHARAWVRGEVKMMESRAAGGHAMAAARDKRGAAPARRVRSWPGWRRGAGRRPRTRCGRLCDQGRTPTVAPRHAMTTATLERVGVEALRYRPNLVIVTPSGCPPYAETIGWAASWLWARRGCAF